VLSEDDGTSSSDRRAIECPKAGIVLDELANFLAPAGQGALGEWREDCKRPSSNNQKKPANCKRNPEELPGVAEGLDLEKR
jgi:hypothetical protein